MTEAAPGDVSGLWDATTVRHDGFGHCDLDLDERWSIGGGINGGHVLVAMARAAVLEVPDVVHPLAVSAHYVAAAHAGPAIVRSTVVKIGRSTATVSSLLEQDGRIAVVATLTFARVAPASDGPAQPTPDFLPREKCTGIESLPEPVLDHAPFMRQVDLRADPRFSGWIVGRPSGRSEIRAWMRLRDGTDPDLTTLLLVADCLPPVTFEHGRYGWAPTVQLTVYLRGEPVPGWLRVRHRSAHLGTERFEEDCEIWDDEGRLVAQARQLALTPR